MDTGKGLDAPPLSDWWVGQPMSLKDGVASTYTAHFDLKTSLTVSPSQVLSSFSFVGLTDCSQWLTTGKIIRWSLQIITLYAIWAAMLTEHLEADDGLINKLQKNLFDIAPPTKRNHSGYVSWLEWYLNAEVTVDQWGVRQTIWLNSNCIVENSKIGDMWISCGIG